MTDLAERRWLAELNLMAGKRAHTATAYESALAYFDVGRALLDDDCWSSHYRTAFELHLHRADCHFAWDTMGTPRPPSKSSPRFARTYRTWRMW